MQKIKDHLIQLGLKDKEADVYLAVLSLGKGIYRIFCQISKRSIQHHSQSQVSRFMKEKRGYGMSTMK
ncbi:MAG: hypothetical protein A2458_00430 [Candidatus Kerfeldbacteria bacterium RIFOXYC2_FULL_38_9]|nr:MAG: hypothetical protein A2458_00430 [Candidatus Kerfeldbacteria bacterium RIFOXYC2_FULL_38_9]